MDVSSEAGGEDEDDIASGDDNDLGTLEGEPRSPTPPPENMIAGPSQTHSQDNNTRSEFVSKMLKKSSNSQAKSATCNIQNVPKKGTNVKKSTKGGPFVSEEQQRTQALNNIVGAVQVAMNRDSDREKVKVKEPSQNDLWCEVIKGQLSRMTPEVINMRSSKHSLHP